MKRFKKFGNRAFILHDADGIVRDCLKHDDDYS